MKRFTQEELEAVGFERRDDNTMVKRYYLDPNNKYRDYQWATFIKCEDTSEDVFKSYGDFLCLAMFKIGYGEKEIKGFERVFREYIEDMRKLGLTQEEEEN